MKLLSQLAEQGLMQHDSFAECSNRGPQLRFFA